MSPCSQAFIIAAPVGFFALKSFFALLLLLIVLLGGASLALVTVDALGLAAVVMLVVARLVRSAALKSANMASNSSTDGAIAGMGFCRASFPCFTILSEGDKWRQW
jgi:hypothetical protein